MGTCCEIFSSGLGGNAVSSEEASGMGFERQLRFGSQLRERVRRVGSRFHTEKGRTGGDSGQGGQEPKVPCRLSAEPRMRGRCSVRRGRQGRPPPWTLSACSHYPSCFIRKGTMSADPGSKMNHQQPSPRNILWLLSHHYFMSLL